MSGYSASPEDPATPTGLTHDEPRSGPPGSDDPAADLAAVAASLLRIDGLTQIIDGLARGMTDEAIARSLGISSRTINRRTTLLMEAVGAHSRFQLGLRLTPELRGAVDAIADITTDADESASLDRGTTRSLRLADRLRRQLERRGRPVQAVMWLWLEGDEPAEPPRG